MTGPENESFAEKLERLFEEKKKPDGTHYTPGDILNATGGVVTRAYLWKLRNGQATNPGLKVIQGLANAFGVSPVYFFDDMNPWGSSGGDDRREDLQMMLRSFGLDRDEQKAMLLMAELLKKSKKQ